MEENTNQNVVTEKTSEEEKKPWWAPEPYQQTVEMADGTILNGHASIASSGSGDLWIWLEDAMSIGKTSMIFEDSEKTKRIISNSTSMDHVVYEGYTLLKSIKLESGGNPTIRMGKE